MKTTKEELDALRTYAPRITKACSFGFAPDTPSQDDIYIAVDASAVIADLLQLAEMERRVEWRPISEAPKDGRWLILATPKGVQCGFWGGTYFGKDPTWIQYAHRSDYEEVRGEPTHFMPLPAPPILDGRDEKGGVDGR